MPNIKITVAGKIATNTTPDVVIVCGNSDYTVTFDLDAEWAAEATRTARFSYIRDGRTRYKEKTFQGNTVAVPKLSGIRQVTVGLYAGTPDDPGDLRTTTAAAVWCKPSILCGDAAEEITPEEKAGLQSQVDELRRDVDDLKENGTGGNTGGNSPDSGQNVTLTTAQIDALHEMFKVCLFDDSKDVDGAISAFETAFGITDSGDGGGEIPDKPDQPGDEGGTTGDALPTNGLQAFFDFRNAEAETTPYTFAIAKTAGDGTWYANIAGGSNGTIEFNSDDIGVANEPVIVPTTTTYPKLTNSDTVAQMPFTVFIQGYNSTPNDAPLMPYGWMVPQNIGTRYAFFARYIDSTGASKNIQIQELPYITGPYTVVCLSVCADWARLYIDGTLAAEVPASDCEDFASWATFNGATHWGYLASDVRRAVSYAMYNRALTDVEIVEATEYLKTLEVTA